ncbi:Benzylsuccinate synthase activating enzyme [subsurface metagenome]
MLLCDEMTIRSMVNTTPKKAIGESGWVTNLQDFVVHDGPGLRILIFFKGCPLRCRWCQNPESLAPFPEIEFHSSLCLGCLKCLEVCPIPGAIIEDKEQRIDRSKCISCMACVDTCLGTALRSVGEWMSVEQVLERIVRYKPFFDRSDRGGVTLSGGEPTFQPEFTLELLKSCREIGIHTVVETCGYTNYETLKRVAQNVDLLIYDIKHMDEVSHITGTGVSNCLILKNLRRLCKEADTDIVVHIPLIPGFNDDDENVTKTAEFVGSLKKIRHIDLLPFNELPSGKYKAMGLDWGYAEVRRQSPERLTELQDMLQSYGLEVNIGGLW